MPPEEKPSREELAEDIAARLRASGLDATSDGQNVNVREPPKTLTGEEASTGRNILAVLGVTLGGIVVTLVGSLIWFTLVFAVLGEGSDTTDVGHRVGVVGFTMAALIGGLGALMTGWDRRTLAGERDMAARLFGIVLGVPLFLITFATAGNALDALTRPYGKLGIFAAFLFFGLFGYVGDRLFKKR